jgi:putative ABC transport system ATP-binding protein
MLSLTDIVKTYRTTEVETRALDGVSLQIGAGEFVAIMGPSVLGEEIAKADEKRLTELRREHIGFVFQSFNLIDDLTVAENVEVALIYRGISGKDRKQRVAEALEHVGISHRARHRPQQLSGGQQQRVAVARALVSRPKLILADEPTGNLDTTNGTAVMELLTGAVDAGATVVMVTHSLAHAAVAKRTIKLLDGRVVSETLLAA